MELDSYIRTLCDKGESTEIEFKSAKGGFPGSLWETYSAFANTNGGIIVLGISEKSGKFISDKLTEAQIAKLKKTLWDGVNNKTTVSSCLLSDSDVIQTEFDGGFVLVVNIPRAEYTQRPVYLTLNPFGGHTYRRRHEGDYKASDDVVRRLMSEAQVALHPLDKSILRGLSIGADIDTETIAQYRRLFDSRNEKHPWSELTDMGFLQKIGAYSTDAESGESGFTLAGVLMFGTQEGLDKAVPYYYVDYRERMSDDPSLRWTDRVYLDGYWEPNLFQFFNRIYPKIRQALPVPFQLEDIVRIDFTSAHKALREAIINCLIHARYGMMNNIVIERYPDRLVFTNPGTMLISVDQFFKGGKSICRNFTLQKMFSFIGFVERAGSGADTIIKGWEENKWPRPQIHEMYDPDMVEMVLLFNERHAEKTREKTREKILQLLQDMPQITTAEIAEKIGITTKGVEWQLAKLYSEKLIRRVGPDNGGHWEVISIEHN